MAWLDNLLPCCPGCDRLIWPWQSKKVAKDGHTYHQEFCSYYADQRWWAASDKSSEHPLRECEK